jgi:hypothetical protein
VTPTGRASEQLSTSILQTTKRFGGEIPVDEEELARLAKRERVDFLLPQIKQ